MTIDPTLWLLFVAATVGFIFTPGPIVSLIVAESLRDGPKHGVAVVAGATLVSLIYLAINYFGFAAVAELPTHVLTGIRYAGVLYLLYLSVQAFLKPVDIGHTDLPPAAAPLWMSFSKSALICFTSPKTILFFAAFFPQFVSSDLPVKPQLLVLSATFLTVAAVLDMTWVLIAAKAKKWLTQKNKLSLANKIAGSVLAAGAITLLLIN
ncbi:MAG: LysE family translocator [Kordiimonadaceae bacterium]|nr:LysE family translocator [Kordiimonadaceae bacterium]MBO6570239.1 LysE family translocator [Kordiimonadaceae bacterium]MBO6965663.1 LysE family translocator [Kordiimonadaceae bacterium]